MAAQDVENAKAQARAQFESIKEMIETLRKARDGEIEDDGEGNSPAEDAESAIHDDALSVEVRGGWRSLNSPEGALPAEYRILLCTGGPAVQIVGELNDYLEPETARIQFQDWFTPWANWRGDGETDETDETESTLLDYARCFYFGG